MAESGICPDCDRVRQTRGRCQCGSFAAPLIRVPDPAKRVAAWGAVPSKAGISAGGVARYQRPQRPEFESGERPCVRCGKTFETTPTRRMLCWGCYKGADGGLDL